MFLSIFFIIAAVGILYLGADLSLGSSESIGRKLKLPPLVIGMLLVGIGTSLPELFVAHIASLEGKSGIATGALVGSNIANMLLILGFAGLFVKMSLGNKNIKYQISVHFILSVTLVTLFSRGTFNYMTGLVLFLICGLYLFFIIHDIRNYQGDVEIDDKKLPIVIVKMLVGFSMLYFGGELLVKGGVGLCEALGVSEYIVSSIFIAFGTSFPELVTVLLSVIKKKDTDLIVGNIIGSNLFNCSLILGSISFYNFNFTSDFTFEGLSLVFGSFFLLFASFMKKDFFRFSGFVFLVVYFIVILSWIGVIDRSNLWI